MLKSYSNIGLDFAHKENSEYFRSDNIHRLQGSYCDLNIDHFNMRENDVSSLVRRSMSYVLLCLETCNILWHGMDAAVMFYRGVLQPVSNMKYSRMQN